MTSILVIDDSPEIRDLIRQVLETSSDYEVHEASDGVQGLVSYQASPADIVLLDMFMPEKDGLETLRELRQMDPNVRVIAMTGGGTYHNVSILKPAMLMGACKLLFKPITIVELQTAIKDVLAGRS